MTDSALGLLIAAIAILTGIIVLFAWRESRSMIEIARQRAVIRDLLHERANRPQSVRQSVQHKKRKR